MKDSSKKDSSKKAKDERLEFDVGGKGISQK